MADSMIENSSAVIPDMSVLSKELFNAVRYGIKSQVNDILLKYPNLKDIADNQGYTVVHWACKKGDIEMLELLSDFGALLNLPTTSEAKMYPIHWGASDGKISSLNFLLEKKQDINVLDANGCTPLIIASQHNQIDAVIYLIKNGADTTVKDVNGDNCFHWACYKGYIEMVGLLSFLLPHEINSVDTFQQTPLHLAALRGNSDVVEYLIVDCGADTTKKDSNGLNPLELSLKKKQMKTEWTIRRLTHSGTVAIFLSLGWNRLTDSTILMFLFCGSNTTELMAWPWRIVFLSNVAGSVVSFILAMSDALSDLYYLHLFTSMLTFLWWITFSMCLLKKPTFVRNSNSNKEKFKVKQIKTASGSSSSSKNRHLDMSISEELVPVSENVSYASVLEVIGKSTSEKDKHLKLCHSCRVIKPLRSKHCKVQRRCVHRFDHFCPFVGNTLGHDNYKYFISLLSIHLVGGTLWQVTAIYYYRRVTISWTLMLFMIYSGFWMILILSLINYHSYLLSSNLTTNEHINSAKYGYMRDEYDDFDNPFNRHDTLLNILDGLFPTKKSFFSREEVFLSLKDHYGKNSFPEGDEESRRLMKG